MIAAVWTLLTSKLAGPIASAVALALALSLAFVWTADHARMGVLSGELASRTKQRDALSRDLGTCKANAEQLASGIRAQNDAILLMQKEADRRAAEAAKAVTGARAEAEGYRTRAADVLTARAGPDRCAAADRVILESLDVR